MKKDWWKPNKPSLIKCGIILVLALAIDILIFWPLYQKIPLSNQQSLDKQIKPLNQDLDEYLQKFIREQLKVPTDRHKICLENRNKFYFIHADSIPYDTSTTTDKVTTFHTENMLETPYGKEVALGAMSIVLHYSDGSREDLYREFGQERHCNIIRVENLKKYSSSNVEYRKADITTTTKVSLNDEKKSELTLMRNMVGGYITDTTDSSAYISARWIPFTIVLFFIFSLLISIFKFLESLNLIKKQNKKTEDKDSGEEVLDTT